MYTLINDKAIMTENDGYEPLQRSYTASNYYKLHSQESYLDNIES